jgi:glycosyltransferase involved in cell wall biosynthesis
MKTSIIIPFMDAFEGKYEILERCLDSLKGADEVIVVDNWKAGYAVPINYGLSQATGDFLIVMNDDILQLKGDLHELCDETAVTSPIEDGVKPQKIWGNCFCIPRWVYEKTGGLDERYRVSYYDDEDFIFTLEELGIPMKCIESVEFSNPHGGTTLHTFPDHNEFYQENQCKFLHKWGRLP